MLSPTRQRLLKRQQELLEHLVGIGAPPPGCDPHRLKLVSQGLKMKRRFEALACWPSLRSFDREFEVYAERNPRPEGGLPKVDGYRFAQFLAKGNTYQSSILIDFREHQGRIEFRPIHQRLLGKIRRSFAALLELKMKKDLSRDPSLVVGINGLEPLTPTMST